MTDHRTHPVSKTEEQWREELTPAEFQVLRQGATERPYVGEYTDTTTEGVYSCRACGSELFRSDTKFESALRLAVPLLTAGRGPGGVHRGREHGHEAGRGPLCRLRLAPRARLRG